MYCGFIVCSNSCFFVTEKIPINSSSKTIGNGVFSQSAAITSICPCFIGCSMECKSKSDKIFNFSKASEG